MIIQVDGNMSIEVNFDPADREEGWDDDVRFCIHESGRDSVRLFAADETMFLLTVEQAERLASALQEAAAERRSLAGSVRPGVPSPDFDS
jgi:hypothetical protein